MAISNIWLIVGLILLILIFAYFAFMPRRVSSEITVGSQKPKIRDYKHLGGEFIVEKVNVINDDKGIFHFSNGMAFTIYYKDLEPVDKLQCITGENPIWVIKSRIIKEEKDEAQDVQSAKIGGGGGIGTSREKVERERDYEHGRAKYLQANIEAEIQKRVEDAGKLSKLAKPETTIK